MSKLDMTMKMLGRKAERDKDVLAVIIFGSYARGEKHRDIDVCIVLKKELSNYLMSKKRLDYSSVSGLDIHIFQQLPLYIRVRVLKEGRVLLCKDIDMLYDLASLTVREFAYFRPRYKEYLKAVKHG